VNLSVGLNKFGYRTTLIVGSPDSTEGSMEGWARSCGADVRLIPSFQAAVSLKKDCQTFVQLVRLFWRERPEIVHTHTFKAGLLGRVAAWVTGVPYIVHTYHGHLLTGYWKGVANRVVVFLERCLALLTTRIVAVSTKVADDLAQAGIASREKISVVELGFDIDSLLRQVERPALLRSDIGLSPEDEVVGIVGRLVPVKAVDVFLRSLAPLLLLRPRLHLVVVGDGSEGPVLKSLAATLSADRIHFSGWRTPFIQDLKDLDLCVCSSRNEGTSVSIIEAVIAGVPVICTEVGGMGDLLGNGRWGDLVPFDESALRAKVKERLELLAEPKGNPVRINFKNRQCEASAVFKERFSSTRLLTDMDRLYEAFGEVSNPEASRPLGESGWPI